MTIEKTSDRYKHIYHYTNWQGLIGILETQSLWATHFKFLNDRSEIMLFMEEKLPNILYPNVLSNYKDILESRPEAKKQFERNGESLDAIVKLDIQEAIIKSLYEPLKDQIYLCSFCGENDDEYINKNGLLSQWRGYGQDGGFAIVFDTEAMEENLQKENDSFLYGYCALGDIVYSDQESAFKTELSSSIKELRDFVDEVIRRSFDKSQSLDNIKGPYFPFLNCITRYKHRGFSEEREVRLVTHVLPPNLIVDQKDTRVQKTIHYRNNSNVPYVKLFGFEEEKFNLPIKKIIVGPHAEKMRRKSTLETMLINTDIEVTISDIPYSE